MSLINEALKRAQRQRGEAPTGAAPPPGTGTPNPSRPTSNPAIKFGLMGSGAVLLVVVGSLVPGFFRSPANSPVTPVAEVVLVKPPPPVVVTPTPPPPPPPVVIAPLPTPIVIPVETPSPAPAPKPPPVVTSPAPDALIIPTLKPTPDPTPAAVIVSPAPPPPGPPKSDPRVEALLGTFHVTAILPSSTSAKAIINGEVYKLNDLVDRTTGLRLTKITNASLTFTDANGLEYPLKPRP